MVVREVSRSVTLISLQFTLPDKTLIADCIRERPRETRTENRTQQQNVSGQLIISPTYKVWLATFFDDLELNEYPFVDAFYEARPDIKRPGHDYYMLRFVAVEQSLAQPSHEFVEREDDIRQAARLLCRHGYWRTRVYRNPSFVNGQLVPGKNTLSINLDFRNPSFNQDGTFVEPRFELRFEKQTDEILLQNYR